VEIEAKFRIRREEMFRQLLEVKTLAGFSLGPVSIANLHDRYLDTGDRALQAGGYACRLRQVDGFTLATVKGLGEAAGAIHRREEHEIELPEPQPPKKWPPSTARDAVLQLCGAERLSTLFEIKQTRHNRLLYDGNRRVAEASLDRIRILRGNTESATFFEFEAEMLPDGCEKDLGRIATELQEVWGLLPESRSKYDRGLALENTEDGSRAVHQTAIEASSHSKLAMENSMEDLRPASAGETSFEEALSSPAAPKADSKVQGSPESLLKRPGVEPDDPMSEAGRKVLRFHFQRMVHHEPGTRMGEDIEALHDMRVATRRMRAAFRVFGDQYEAKATAPYLKGLKQTGRALGPVRDLDVFRAKIQTYLHGLPEAQQGGMDSLLQVLEERREAARDRMIAHLDSEKYRQLADGFGTFLETPGMGSLPIRLHDSKPRPYRVRHIAPTSIYQRLADVRAYDEWVQDVDPPLTRLHALRIACKRLRYTLEFFREVLGPETKSVIKEVVVMQDHLGALQDTVVASSILSEYLRWGTWGQDIPQALPGTEKEVAEPGVSAYLAAQKAETQHLIETFPGRWQKLKEARFSQLVANLVMVL
jgi:CHAD domain-containing protein